jgi:hypothetical protein
MAFQTSPRSTTRTHDRESRVNDRERQSREHSPRPKAKRFESSAESADGLGGLIVSACTAPAKGIGWLTGNVGGRAVIGVLALYCAALSVESWYVAMPILANQPGAKENRKFVPKPFIGDGADLGLLSPGPVIDYAWDTAMNVLHTMLPFQLKAPPRTYADCVWLDWRFYVAAAASFALQMWQARALRSLSISDRRQKALALAGHKKMALDPNSLAIAQARALEYNASLTGRRTANGAMIFLSYAVELGTGWVSVSQATGIGILTAGIYCIIQAFGFEVMLNQLEDQSELEK